MKQTLIIASLLGLFVSTGVFSQDQTVSSDDTAQTEERSTRGDKDDNNKRRNDRNNGELSRRALRIIDVDEDGQISFEEYMAHAQQRFSDLDLDGNNFVTSSEAKEAAEIMRQRQKEARSTLNKRKQSSEAETTSE
jgi:hypothetical protein